eukprot:gene1530-1620_t
MLISSLPQEVIDVILQYYVISWQDILKFGGVCHSWRETSRKSIVWRTADLTFHAPSDYIHIYRRLLLLRNFDRGICELKVMSIQLPLKQNHQFTYACSEVQVMIPPESDNKTSTKVQPIIEISETFCNLLKDYNKYWFFYNKWWNCLYKLLIKIDDNSHSYRTFLLSSFFFLVQAVVAFVLHYYENNHWLIGGSFAIAYIPVLLYSFLHLLDAINILADLLLRRTETSFSPTFYWNDINTYFGNTLLMLAVLGCWFMLLLLTQMKLLHPSYDDQLPWTIVTFPVWLLYLIHLIPIVDSPEMKSYDNSFLQSLAFTLTPLGLLPIPCTISTLAYSYDYTLPLNQTVFPYLYYILYFYGILMIVYALISCVLSLLSFQSIERSNARWKGIITSIGSVKLISGFYFQVFLLVFILI